MLFKSISYSAIARSACLIALTSAFLRPTNNFQRDNHHQQLSIAPGALLITDEPDLQIVILRSDSESYSSDLRNILDPSG